LNSFGAACPGADPWLQRIPLFDSRSGALALDFQRAAMPAIKNFGCWLKDLPYTTRSFSGNHDRYLLDDRRQSASPAARRSCGVRVETDARLRASFLALHQQAGLSTLGLGLAQEPYIRRGIPLQALEGGWTNCPIGRNRARGASPIPSVWAWPLPARVTRDTKRQVCLRHLDKLVRERRARP